MSGGLSEYQETWHHAVLRAYAETLRSETEMETPASRQVTRPPLTSTIKATNAKAGWLQWFLNMKMKNQYGIATNIANAVSNRAGDITERHYG